ncbi:MAG: hypothetical protein V1790_17355 [Planctomycetota bacterium]
MTCRRCLSLVAAMEQVARDLDHEGYTSREMHSLEASLVLDAIADWKLNGLEHAAFWRRIARCFWPGDHP